MKRLTTNKIFQKIILTLILIVSLCFITPQRVYADMWSDLGGSLLKEVMQFLSAFGDITMGFLNNVMLGADLGSAMISEDDRNLSDENSWLYYDGTEFTKEFKDGEIDTNSFIKLEGDKAFEVPNMLYCPENIFANNIAALDVNFLSPNKFTSVIQGDDNAKDKAESSAKVLRTTISSWYKSFRSIAVVGLLSVLIYLGIRILLSSAADDKAKYKESLKDWLVALCLVFVIHFIMSGILMITDKVTNLFSTSITNGITISAKDGSNTVKFRTNLIGLVRFQAQSDDAQTTCAYTIIYLALVIYTVVFTFMYYKRFLYTAFFTMIAPLVALTYPIDKIGDGKAQAFNMWFKEYTMNVIIQPVHLILYTVFVSSASDLAAGNPLYALVAIAFLLPAEKFVKKMFGLDRAETTSGFGSYAVAAGVMSGLKKLSAMGAGSRKNGEKNGKGESDEDSGNLFDAAGTSGNLDSFKDGNGANNNENPGNDEKPTGPEDQQNGNGGNDADDNDNPEPPVNTADDNDNPEPPVNTADDNDNPEPPEDTERTNGPMPTGGGTFANSRRNSGRGHYRTRFAIRGVKALGKGAWKNAGKAARILPKAAGRIVGAGAGATIGLAAGLTTGDFGKTLSFAAGGAYAGSQIGKKAVNLGTNAAVGTKDFVTSSRDKVKYAYNEEKYGRAEARRRQKIDNNKKARAKFVKDDKALTKWEKVAADMGFEGDMAVFMNCVADYKQEGLDDDKIIQGLKTEQNKGGIGGNKHAQVVDMATYVNKGGYGKEYIEDEKKRNAMEDQLGAAGLNKGQKKEAMEIFASLQGKEQYYKNNSKLYK